jgi:hypothetical protein
MLSFRWNVFAIVAAALLLSSCSQRLDFNECLQEYAAKGNTQQLVRWGYTLCKTASDEAVSRKKRLEALCAVKEIPTTPTEVGFRLVVAQCQRE